MTTLGPVTKLTPQREGFYVFAGVRHIRNALYEHIVEPVQIVETMSRGQRALAVAMTGRQHRVRIETFTGTWQPIELEETP